MYSCQGGTFNKKHFPTQWQKARKYLTSGYHYILLQLVSVKVNTGQENHTNQRQKWNKKLTLLSALESFSFSGGVAMCYAIPVLWMMPFETRFMCSAYHWTNSN